MKKILKIIPFILFCTACESDPELTPDQYPIPITLDVTEIDSTGASFKAEIVNTNYIAITECGFVWRKDEKPSLADYWCSVTPAIISGNYSKRISGGLVEGKRYCVRAYAKGVDFLVYGTDTWFESKGSLPVKIHDFHPDSFRLGGERFVIEGESFSTMPAENHVYFGSTRISVISSYPDSLIIMTPIVTKSEVVSVSVEVNGHTALCDKPLKMVYPWKRIGDFPGGALNNAVAFVIGDKAYVGCGETDSLSNEFWQYDPVEDSWIQVATFPGTGKAPSQGRSSGR
ncbi:MAG: IPT/TIG domain-containing protein [Bacteroidales bacterium]|nr:IPT/TIG domain-containing protein [Bacteroidales bacterium]